MHWKINKETLKQNFSLSIKSGQETCNSLRNKIPFLTCFISSWSPQFNPRSWKMQKNCVVQGQTAFSRLAHIGNQSTRRLTNSPTPTRRRIKSSRDVGTWHLANKATLTSPMNKIGCRRQWVWWCLLRFIRLEILINFVANKNNCFLLKILSRKPSFR